MNFLARYYTGTNQPEILRFNTKDLYKNPFGDKAYAYQIFKKENGKFVTIGNLKVKGEVIGNENVLENNRYVTQYIVETENNEIVRIQCDFEVV